MAFKPKISELGSKKTFSVVGWLIAAFFAIYFSKKIFQFFQTMFGDRKTDEQLQDEQQQKTDIENILKKYPNLYQKTSKNKTYLDSIANSLENEFNRTKTNWSVIKGLISNLTDMDLVGLYCSFGSRLNTDWANLQGDLIMWIQKEDEGSFLDFFKTDDVKYIKKRFYIVSGIIPSAARFKGNY